MPLRLKICTSCEIHLGFLYRFLIYVMGAKLATQSKCWLIVFVIFASQARSLAISMTSAAEKNLIPFGGGCPGVSAGGMRQGLACHAPDSQATKLFARP
jgi:hypothetical protein